MEKPTELNISKEIDQPSSPEQEKVRIIPVEELIPNIKPAIEKSGKPTSDTGGHSFDDCYIQDFIRGFEGQRFLQDEKMFSEELKSPMAVLKERLKDQIVVDLGADAYGHGYFLSQIWGSKGVKHEQMK
jgi:hypothetical protein